MNPWWSPSSLADRMPFLLARGRISSAVRSFFANHGFVEVETPILQASPGMEVHVGALSTRLCEPFQESGGEVWLHTSPEFAMKKLLAGGMEKIFQLARVFRDGERSPTHHPEFTMLEWYRSGASYIDLMDDCQALLRVAAAAAGAGEFRFQGRTADPLAPLDRISVAEAFARFAGIDLLPLAHPVDAPKAGPIADVAGKIGIHVGENDGFEDIFFRIMLERIEPRLGIGRGTVLYDYPLSLAALSRPKIDDPRLAERFELYVCGLELANAFGELTDAAEQERRFRRDMDEKQRLYGKTHPIDPDFLEALRHGLPESAGIAMGFDRLVMLATGTPRMEDVLWAPVAGATGKPQRDMV